MKRLIIALVIIASLLIPSPVSAGGYYNRIITVSAEGGDYTSLYTAIRDNYSGLTAETRILIKVKGEITETQMIHAESYIDVIGDKDAVITQRGVNVYGVIFDHPFTTWKNITVVNRGTNVMGAPACVITGPKPPYAAGADRTTVLINCTFITEHTTNVTGQTAISIRGNASPRLYNVVGIGGNAKAGYGHGILVTGTASPRLVNCTAVVRNAKAKAWLFLFDAKPIVISGVAILLHPDSIAIQLENNADPIIRGFKVLTWLK